MSIVIRPYVERDEQGWLRCRVLSFLDTAFFDSVEREKERYEKPAIELVAEDGREIIGLLDLECDSDGLADRPGRGGMIWHLAVHPDRQRQGIASSLLEAAERQARDGGLVRLEAWTRDDAHVQRWYEHHGFTQIDSYLHVYLERDDLRPFDGELRLVKAEDDLLLVTALDEIGIDSRPAIWSDTGIDWLGFDAVVIRTPWDYFVRPVEFRAWLDARIASGVLMCNSGEILVWNFDKVYLQDLAAAGVSLVPTIVVSRGEHPDIVALARARGWEEIVVKPTISGGAYCTHRFRLDEADRYRDDIARTLPDRGLLIQPFLPEILNAGELSLLFFDGVFSHAVCKRPKDGDYRVQFQFGGTNETVEVRDEWIEGARACIAAAPALPVYARVDGVIQNGKFLLMELEVFEPLMFLARHPEAAGRFARAIKGRLV